MLEPAASKVADFIFVAYVHLGHEKGVNCVEYFSGGDRPYLVSGADDKTVKVWDLHYRYSYRYMTVTFTVTLPSPNRYIYRYVTVTLPSRKGVGLPDQAVRADHGGPHARLRDPSHPQLKAT